MWSYRPRPSQAACIANFSFSSIYNETAEPSSSLYQQSSTTVSQLQQQVAVVGGGLDRWEFSNSPSEKDLPTSQPATDLNIFYLLLPHIHCLAWLPPPLPPPPSLPTTLNIREGDIQIWSSLPGFVNQQALKSTPFTCRSNLCRYGNMHFSSLPISR